MNLSVFVPFVIASFFLLVMIFAKGDDRVLYGVLSIWNYITATAMYLVDVINKKK